MTDITEAATVEWLKFKREFELEFSSPIKEKTYALMFQMAFARGALWQVIKDRDELRSKRHRRERQ